MTRHRGDIPKAFWTVDHYRENLSEAESMLELARQNPHMFSPTEWEAEVTRRRDEAAKAGA